MIFHSLLRLRARLLLAAFATVAVLSASVFAATAASPAPVSPQNSAAVFSDVSADHPFAATIATLKAKGLVKGYKDGTFAPDSSVTRAEFITMVMASVAGTSRGRGCFADVKGHWSERFVCAAKARGLVKGYADGKFRPHANINFSEASIILAKANALKPAATQTGEPWYKPAVEKLAAKAAIPTSIETPDQRISRAETGEMILRLKEKIATRPTKTFASLTAEVPVVSSCSELKEKFQLFSYRQGRGRFFERGLNMEDDMAIPMMAEKAESSAPATSGASDYSSTNVQVAGVDEADIVKNDGEFIYIVSRSSVRIVKAYPANAMAEVGKAEFGNVKFQPTGLYITNTKLVVVGSKPNYYDIEEGPGDTPYRIYRGDNKTKVYIFSMSPERKLTEERTVEFEGYELSSRRIGSSLFLVMNQRPPYHILFERETPEYPETPVEDVLPRFLDSAQGSEEKPLIDCSDVHFLPRADNADFVIVAALNIDDSSAPIEKEVIMGAGNTVYASLKNLYVAGTRYEYPEIEKFDVWAPPQTNQKTEFFQFSLFDAEGKPQVAFQSRGEVPGHLLNQFSMDEHGNAFRAAVTVERQYGPSESASKSQNHIFLLDASDLTKTLGSLRNIAPGEKIYSARFMGNRAYLVTFKYVDPFFVIDLADPAAPKILGELKIPGYSDYLHPYDEDHIIGFGKDVDESIDADKVHMNDAVYYTAIKGMKIALFDVSDVANPKEMYKEVIGGRGTDSELLRDHKALLFDKAKNLLAFPVRVTEEKSGDEYDQTVIFQGAYIYTLDLENGFALKGKVTHFDTGNAPSNQVNWYDEASQVRRIIEIGENLYTISLGKIKALRMADMEELKALPLESSTESGGPILMK